MIEDDESAELSLDAYVVRQKRTAANAQRVASERQEKKTQAKTTCLAALQDYVGKLRAAGVKPETYFARDTKRGLFGGHRPVYTQLGRGYVVFEPRLDVKSNSPGWLVPADASEVFEFHRYDSRVAVSDWGSWDSSAQQTMWWDSPDWLLRELAASLIKRGL